MAKTDKPAAKTPFAPIAETIETLRSKIEVPEAAREFVQRGADAAQERANALQAGAEKVTKAVETAAVDSVAEIAKVSRALQTAWFEDVNAFLGNVEKLSQAKCLSEAMQSQADFLRARSEVAVTRARAAGEYVTTLANSGAAKLREGLAGFGSKAA